MYANDGQRIFDAVTFAPLVLMGPLVLIGGIIYLLRVIGPWSLLGLAVFLVFDVLQVYYGLRLLNHFGLDFSRHHDGFMSQTCH